MSESIYWGIFIGSNCHEARDSYGIDAPVGLIRLQAHIAQFTRYRIDCGW